MLSDCVDLADACVPESSYVVNGVDCVICSAVCDVTCVVVVDVDNNDKYCAYNVDDVDVVADNVVRLSLLFVIVVADVCVDDAVVIVVDEQCKCTESHINATTPNVTCVDAMVMRCWVVWLLT